MKMYSFIYCNVYILIQFSLMFCVWSFDDTNLTRLRKEVKMNGNDGSLFNFDPKSMDLHKYLLNVHVPAVLKYGRKKKGSV